MAQNHVLFEIIGSTGGNALVLNKSLVAGDSLEISNDGVNWRAWAQAQTISISSPLRLRGKMPNGLDGYNFSLPNSSTKIKVSGNIMALIDWENPDATTLTQERAFHEIFKDCVAIQDASELELPATTLSDTCYAKMFMGCTSLVNAPALPATQLNQYCYASMFEGCTSLSTPPSLPATVMAKRCYSSMFTDSGLTVAPQLPATTLAEGCYNCMFLRCSNITVAPLLPAEELQPYCYAHLCDGWSNLEVAPSLPASNLAAHCYDSMFADCSSLREAPYMGAITVADSACLYMFLRCTSLVKSPVLRAKKLVSSCYKEMFAACASLTEVTCLATSGIGENLATYNWLRDRSALGVFICEGGTENLWSRDDSGVPANWTISPLAKVPRNIILQNLQRFHEKLKTEIHPNLLTAAKTIVGAINELAKKSSPKYLCFEVIGFGMNTLRLSKQLASGESVEYSLDNGNTWNAMPYQFSANDYAAIQARAQARLDAIDFSGEDEFEIERARNEAYHTILQEEIANAVPNEAVPNAISFGNGTKLYVRGKMPNGWSKQSFNYLSFVFGADAKVKVSGNIMTLLDWENPDTVALNIYCFYSLFNDCTTLQDASKLELPATTLEEGCYTYMFLNCTSLVNAPALPATTLATRCYNNMFNGCTSLVNAPALPATTLASSCYSHMFYGCTSLVNAPALPATTLATYCYYGMFNGCTSLVNAPALPATTLATHCYNNMFDGCTGLLTVTCKATNISASNATFDWLFGVASKGTFKCPVSMISTWPRNASGVPISWTIEPIDTPFMYLHKLSWYDNASETDEEGIIMDLLSDNPNPLNNATALAAELWKLGYNSVLRSHICDGKHSSSYKYNRMWADSPTTPKVLRNSTQISINWQYWEDSITPITFSGFLESKVYTSSNNKLTEES